MATAEQLLNDAQFAFSQVTFGDSPANRRHATRAARLARRIMRSYPGSMEAMESQALLRRLGEEAYVSNIGKQHRHITAAQHHARTVSPAAYRPGAEHGSDVRPDWAGLAAALLTLPKSALAALAFAGFFVFSLAGPFLLVPLVLLVLFAGPLRRRLSGEQQTAANAAILALNGWVAERRGRRRVS